MGPKKKALVVEYTVGRATAKTKSAREIDKPYPKRRLAMLRRHGKIQNLMAQELTKSSVLWETPTSSGLAGGDKGRGS